MSPTSGVVSRTQRGLNIADIGAYLKADICKVSRFRHYAIIKISAHFNKILSCLSNRLSDMISPSSAAKDVCDAGVRAKLNLTAYKDQGY